MALFRDIPAYTQARYVIDVPMRDVAGKIGRWLSDGLGLQLEPDFQRGHVWTEAQQILFVEHMLRGAVSGREINFNHPGWMKNFKGEFVLVDGLQRLTAVTRFLKGAIPAFGAMIADYKDRIPDHIGFRFNVADLATRAEVLRWYLELNTGGVVHSAEEIVRVKGLLAAELAAAA